MYCRVRIIRVVLFISINHNIIIGENDKTWVCVCGVVLPKIRRTGSYFPQPNASAATEADGRRDKRLEGKELMRLKNASLQQLIAGPAWYHRWILADRPPSCAQ